MKINIKLLTIVLIILSFVFISNNRVLGQEEVNDEVKALNAQIQAQKDKIEEIQKRQEVYSQAIKEKQKEKASLNNQVYLIDNRLAKAELDITSTEIEMDRVNLEVKKARIEIDGKNKEIENEKGHIGDVLKLMYKESRVNTLEVLLLNDSLTDFLNQVKHLEDINKEVGNSLDVLKKYKNQLEKTLVDLDDKNKDLLSLKKELEEKKEILESEKGSKVFILSQVASSEKEYQRLLEQSKKEQAAASADIANLEKTVRDRVNQLAGGKLEFNDAGLIWPVPQNSITSYFHDPDYPFRYIFEHPAIDIRASQGTALKAAASGYVARAKIEGSSYGYIMIVHGDGLSTVYGHASKSFVKEDEYVVQGQVIGLSGGMPGTTGAGSLTTGPHLHFEVRLNGIPVNPLEYLP
ncbi:hypothetical protein COV49_04110 [Candidatus Falkowbacteria bacterium CG11_big_fil_rev_8_21_14_0_20_39_10]|uniref:M23ase beta-sheet core domain-containing protein n=1 Tax=Candidatus Falkowbacteria bacterium CG11_big_fil_rev_8_21_14_0_20_39_10 TaxID=1974570 RepID=A0A2M6K896_9BACT|nr:MAG: hypothetical protein COV49_04110 [Candidatus Falkowbacteria bacterium CG11_big_fil_rev_8_21_14_0_20_39_10]